MSRSPKHEPEDSSAQTGRSLRVKKGHKRSPGRPKIPPDRIVEAAKEIIDAHGIDALSMRAIAEHLDSGTATLYRHFSSRTKLIGYVVDRILSEASLDLDDDEPRDWQSIVAFSARSMYALLNRYKGIAALLAESIPVGPNSMERRERLIGLLLANGFSAEVASRAYATIARFVLGFAIQHSDQGDSVANASQPTSLYRRGVDSEKYPALHAVARHLPIGLEDEFEFGLQLILSGLSLLKEGKRWVAPGIGDAFFPKNQKRMS